MDIRHSYREAGVHGASAVGLVVRLYEQMIEDMRQVTIAIGKNDIVLRTNRIKHAILVLAHLQSTLDFARGGKVSRDLEAFYDSLRQRLLAVQFRPSLYGVMQIKTDLLTVREAWIKVELAEWPSIRAQMVMPAEVNPEQRVDWEG